MFWETKIFLDSIGIGWWEEDFNGSIPYSFNKSLISIWSIWSWLYSSVKMLSNFNNDYNLKPISESSLASVICSIELVFTLNTFKLKKISPKLFDYCLGFFKKEVLPNKVFSFILVVHWLVVKSELILVFTWGKAEESDVS